MSAHYTRDFTWVVHVSQGSINLQQGVYDAYVNLGVNGIYLNAADPYATNAKRAEVVSKGFKCGLFYPANTQFMSGKVVGQNVSDSLGVFAKTEEGGQTPVLCDFEPEDGSVTFWRDFIGKYRALRPGRVTDFTPAPFKASVLPVSDLLNSRFDVRVQYYFGDMSPVDGGEAREDWVNGNGGVGFPQEAIRGFVDGGRVIKPPIFYQGQRVRNLEGGSVIWNSNLLREAGLI